MNICISGIVFKVHYMYQKTREFLKEYETNESSQYTISITKKDIEREQNGNYPYDYLETIALLRRIGELLPYQKCLLCHGASIRCDDKGYIFMAPSQTGKTTHIQLWKKYLKKRVQVINGDKPVLSFASDGIWIHGTPWAGKEGWQINDKVMLNGICFLKQSPTNHIRSLTPSEALDYLMKQVYITQSIETLSLTLEMIDKLLNQIPCYLLECDMSYDAFSLSYQTMYGGLKNED